MASPCPKACCTVTGGDCCCAWQHNCWLQMGAAPLAVHAHQAIRQVAARLPASCPPCLNNVSNHIVSPEGAEVHQAHPLQLPGGAVDDCQAAQLAGQQQQGRPRHLVEGPLAGEELLPLLDSQVITCPVALALELHTSVHRGAGSLLCVAARCWDNLRQGAPSSTISSRLGHGRHGAGQRSRPACTHTRWPARQGAHMQAAACRRCASWGRAPGRPLFTTA